MQIDYGTCVSQTIHDKTRNMLQTQQDKQVPAFSYEVFDRQLDHFTMMLKVLMEKKCTLIDYEKIENEEGKRLIFLFLRRVILLLVK